MSETTVAPDQTVVEEHAFALREPLVLLARDVLPGPAFLRGLDAFGNGDGHLATALTASKMFQ